MSTFEFVTTFEFDIRNTGFCHFGERVFAFRVVFIGPQVFKTKAANDSDGLGYDLLVTAGQWSMC